MRENFAGKRLQEKTTYIKNIFCKGLQFPAGEGIFPSFSLVLRCFFLCDHADINDFFRALRFMKG